MFNELELQMKNFVFCKMSFTMDTKRVLGPFSTPT